MTTKGSLAPEIPWDMDTPGALRTVANWAEFADLDREGIVKSLRAQANHLERKYGAARPAKSDRGHANANRVALTGLIVVGLGTGASFAHPYLAWWMIPLVFLWLLAGVAIACVVGGGERR